MKKARIIGRIIAILLVFAVLCIIMLLIFEPRYNEKNKTFYIRNNSDKVLTGANLYYPEIDYTAIIPDIPPKTLGKMEIDMVAAGTKNTSILLMYSDSNGAIHQEKITDYFMCIGGGGLEIKIDSIDQESLIYYQKYEYGSFWSGFIKSLKAGQEALSDKIFKRAPIGVFYIYK